jgi:hypothetical protein
MISAMISRLAFGDLIGKPESEAEARAQLEDKKWEFLGLAILVGIITFLVFIVFNIALIVFYLIVIGFVSVLRLEQENRILVGLIILLGIFTVFIFIAALTWIFSRLIIAELPLAIETPMDVSNSIKRSWNLTKGYVLRLQGIILIAFLITLPLQIVVQTLAFAARIFLGRFMDEESATFALASFVISYIIGIGSSLFVVPFWQAVKAVIYYDVRSRSEGLGIEIRDRA